MNNYILFDEKWTDFLPLSFTRPISYFRIGILTIKEKWELLLNADFSVKTVDYLSKKYPSIIEDKNILINSRVLPDNRLIEKIQELKLNQYIYKEDLLIAACIDRKSTECFDSSKGEYLGEKIDYKNEIIKIDYLYDIFQKNDKALIDDFNLLTNNKISQPISLTNRCIGEENIYIEEGAKVEFSILNATTGPIYIGKDAEIMEGCMIRGPFSLGNHSQLKMGAKIYGPVTIGPHSRVGGEVTHSVFFGYSNKAHDGFLGHSVIGEWCNLGADTNNSNLKNNYAEVKLWNYTQEKFISTKLQFCGLIMGDHSKCGINTMFNTGTVVGVSANIFGAGYPRNYIPSFSWGGAHGFTIYKLDDALKTAEIVMHRRGKRLDDIDKEILMHIFKMTEKYRHF